MYLNHWVKKKADLLTCSRKCRVVPSGSPIKLDPKMPAVWCQKDDGVSRPSLALWLDGTVSCSVGVRPGHEVLSFVKVHCCIMHIPLVSWKTRERLDCQGLKPWSSQCKGRGIFVNGPTARSNRNKRSGPTKTSNQWELTTQRQLLPDRWTETRFHLTPHLPQMGGFLIIPGLLLCIWDTLWLTVQNIEDFMGPYVGGRTGMSRPKRWRRQM